MMSSSGGQLMETTLMTISLTDIEDSEEGSHGGQLMVDMECPNCKVHPVITLYAWFLRWGLLVFATFDPFYK